MMKIQIVFFLQHCVL